MSLPLIGSVPQTQDDWEGWGQNHFINHTDLAAALSAQKNVQGLVFPIAFIDNVNFDLWLYRHSLMHNQLNQVLGTQGFDLLDLDPTDPDELQQWILQNQEEHERFCTALGVS